MSRAGGMQEDCQGHVQTHTDKTLQEVVNDFTNWLKENGHNNEITDLEPMYLMMNGSGQKIGDIMQSETEGSQILSVRMGYAQAESFSVEFRLG